ncbi:MAG: Mrp/NBP35 family ATP-binding protein [Bacteroidia bacterium]
MITTTQVIDALRNVDDPDLHKDLVTLNMVKDVAVDGLNVAFTVVLTTPACPMKDMIQRACENAIIHYVNKDAIVNIKMTANVTAQANKSLLPNVKNIIAVASGKGGVGKSTVAANLAVALAGTGASVGLLDADVYGPSQHIMFDVAHEKPMMKDIDGKSYIVPIESHGVKLLSIGFFASMTDAIVWRGPMASKTVQQLISDAAWGDLDYMIIDLPPGTGDIHLSIVNAIKLTGSVIVSTPQHIALADVQRGISMFALPSINVPVLGIIENMAYFTPAELPNNKYYLFGKDGAANMAENLGVPLLGQIPIVQAICEGGDKGEPAVIGTDNAVTTAFLNVARAVAQQVAIVNANKNATAEAEV